MPLSAEYLIGLTLLVQAGAPFAMPRATVAPASQAASSDLPAGSGPRGTSGQQRGDAVEFAAIGPGAGSTIATSDLPPGSIAEVTDLGSGAIILARVVPGEDGRASAGVVLSAAAASALHATGPSLAVRWRQAVASPAEVAALNAGGSVPTRISAPPVLLTALRRRLPPRAVEPVSAGTARDKATAIPPAKQTAKVPARVSASTRSTAAKAPAASGWFVQLAALSDLARAQGVASSERGRVISSRGLHRIRLGPFASQASAQSARDAATRRGYAGAQIVHVD